MSIWSVLIYSVARIFKRDLMKNKLLKTLPELKKSKYIDVSGMFVWKKNRKQQCYNRLTFGNVLLDLKMLLTWVLQIFGDLYSVSLLSLASSPVNSDSSKSLSSITSSEPWYLLWKTLAIFSGKCIYQNDVANYIPTMVLKGWLLNYCSICRFHQVNSSICLLGFYKVAAVEGRNTFPLVCISE